jgi:phage/plasmid primase-like uncharacterized protein
LKKHLEANAIPYVDMRENFRQETIKHPGDKLYLLRDTHGNDRGNQREHLKGAKKLVVGASRSLGNSEGARRLCYAQATPTH